MVEDADHCETTEHAHCGRWITVTKTLDLDEAISKMMVGFESFSDTIGLKGGSHVSERVKERNR